MIDWLEQPDPYELARRERAYALHGQVKALCRKTDDCDDESEPDTHDGNG